MDAARRALRIRDGLAAVAEWEREHGELTKDEMAAARARIAGATTLRADIWTSDPEDLGDLARHTDHPAAIRQI